MPMEPDLYRALRAKDLGRVRECLRDWGKENRRVWWGVGGAGSAALTPLHVGAKGSSQDILRELLKHPEIGRSINTFTDKTNVRSCAVVCMYTYGAAEWIVRTRTCTSFFSFLFV